MSDKYNPSFYLLRTYLNYALFTLCFISITNCSSLVSTVSEGLADNLSGAIKDQDDPETVKQGAPAYLILIDGLIAGDPENINLLSTGAKLYSAYAGVFVEDPVRAKRLAGKAWSLATQAMCQGYKEACGVHTRPFDEFIAFLPVISKADVGLLYMYGTIWAGFVQSNADDWNAVADLPKVTAVIKQVQILDDLHDKGGVHLYLGVLASLLPPSLGGKPEQAKLHFERAIEQSQGHNLMVKVIYAEKYARMLFNRPLHDEILQGVIKADPHKPGLTLMNIIAQNKAKALLKSADEYF